MLPLLLVAFFTLAARALGGRGWPPGRSWRLAALHAISVTSIITGAAAVTPMREDMARMLPDALPHPQAWVVAAGTAQVAAGAALWIPAARPIAAAVLGALVCAKLPANLKAVREGLWIRGPLPTPPWMRLPDTVLWLMLIVWVIPRRTADRASRAGSPSRTVVPPPA